MRTKVKRRNLFIDFLVVIVLVALAGYLTFAWRLDIMVSILLFLAVPSVYLWLRKKKNAKKIVLSSLTFGVLAGMSWNFVAEFNNAWVVHYHSIFLNYHVVGKTPLGNFAWAFLIPFFVITFYEHFLDDEHRYRIAKHYKKVLLAAGILFLIPIVRFVGTSTMFDIHYAYFILGLLSTLPLLYLIWAKPWLVKKILAATLFFVFVNILFELVALESGLWSFPGEYIGWITVGALRFPIEELIFWIIPSTAVFLVCYELCFDDAA